MRQELLCPAAPIGFCRCRRSRTNCNSWFHSMPLIRKTPDEAVKSADTTAPAPGLTDASPDARWAAARAAADRPEAVSDLAQALARESDAQVREAIFTALARIASSESVLAVLPYVRSDNANLRTGALDTLRAMPELTKPHYAGVAGLIPTATCACWSVTWKGRQSAIGRRSSTTSLQACESRQPGECLCRGGGSAGRNRQCGCHPLAGTVRGAFSR